jgi:hypothetical protein
MKAELIKDMDTPHHRIAKGEPPVKKAGTIIVHPHAWALVRLGVAIPADKECEEKANMSREQIDAAGKIYAKAGIAHEDHDAFDQGLMTGYKPDGTRGDTWIPGPKWSEGAEQAYYDSRKEQEDDDDE